MLLPNKRISLPNFEPLADTTVDIPNMNALVQPHDYLIITNVPGCCKWLCFAQGKKDNWCIYRCEMAHNQTTGTRVDTCFIPKDVFYFERIAWLAQVLSDFGISSDTMYGHFYYIYSLCNEYRGTIHPVVTDAIQKIVNRYYVPYNQFADFPLSEMMLELFYMIYMAMVAEEYYVSSNGNPTVFGSAIKLLALNEILIQHRPYRVVAQKYTCSSGDGILEEASRLGIVRI